MYGSQPNVGLGGSPLALLIMHALSQRGQQQPPQQPAQATGTTTDLPGLIQHLPGLIGALQNHLATAPRTTMPIARRAPEISGTPALQGFRGGMSSRFNPNEGGFSGPGASEMTHPGLASGLFGSSAFGLPPVQ